MNKKRSVKERKGSCTDHIYILFVGQMDQGHSNDAVECRKGEYIPIKDAEEPQLGMFDKPLPCFGCGIGWFSLLLGFVFPLMWYFASVLYFGGYYHKDPRERSGLGACAIAVMWKKCNLKYIIPLGKHAKLAPGTEVLGRKSIVSLPMQSCLKCTLDHCLIQPSLDIHMSGKDH